MEWQAAGFCAAAADLHDVLPLLLDFKLHFLSLHLMVYQLGVLLLSPGPRSRHTSAVAWLVRHTRPILSKPPGQQTRMFSGSDFCLVFHVRFDPLGCNPCGLLLWSKPWRRAGAVAGARVGDYRRL